MRFLPVNLDALLVELDDLPQTLALHASLAAAPIAGVDEVVPAARTLLVSFRPAAIARERLIAQIAARPLDIRADAGDATTVELPVVYDGEDLDEVARLTGFAPAEVVRRHAAADYRVAFTGFAPGFAYLSGGDPALQVPRRSTPRTRIAPGAVGLAGPFSGVYPRASPGGWQIVGRTATPMWDVHRERPALLQPGDRVRFVAVEAASADAPRAVVPPADPAPAPAAAATTATALDVVQAGWPALFQDLGRPGQAVQGVSASGAMDRAALRAANRLVGNPPDAAAVEIVLGGFAVVARGAATVAVTGAAGRLELAGAAGPLELRDAAGAAWPVPRDAPLALADGDRLTILAPTAGFRSYLAVRGGFAVAPVLGSCATDTLAGVGPPAIVQGDRLGVRPAAPGAVVGAPPTAPPDLPIPGEPVMLDIVLGPRTDWFTPEAVERLAAQRWTVTPASNRIGLRLAGDLPLERVDTRRGAELPSEGTAKGALQVPPDGNPVLFLADHPLTGGYPVIAGVAAHHLDRAGQIPIGAEIRFRLIRAFDPTERP